jgi:potassium channel subfamily K
VFSYSYGVLVEGWTVIESLYYAAITASTVGYGDYAPSEQWSRLLCVFFLPLAVAVFCEVLGRIAGSYLDYKIQLQEHKFLHRQLTLSDLDCMDADHDGSVMWGEFMAFMLVAMQKVDKADIEELRKVFDHLDKTGTGQLNKNDIKGIVRERTQRRLQLSGLD